MNMIEKEIFLSLVYEMTEKNPLLFRDIIDRATMGVKQYADSQRNIAGQIAFQLFAVLEQIEVPESGKFGPFTCEEVLDKLEDCFGGTSGLKMLRKKYGVEEINSEDVD